VSEPTVNPDPAKRDEAAQVVGEILGHMALSAKLDAKDAAGGAISIAVQLAEPVPGVVDGKRSPFSDALQYLVNKRINRPGAERRHVMVGIGGHPEPRAPKPPRAPAAPSPAGGPAPQAPAAAPVAKGRAQGAAAPARTAPAASREPDERTLAVETAPALAKELQHLAEASAAFGRYFALIGLSAEDRARVVQGTAKVAQVSTKVEGEGRNRRVVLVPAKPVPLPRQRLPVEDIEDLEDEEA
jgi:predicted RNA-binding protein Jag